MTSRLKVLMENFSISGKDLSALLHVDSSLVSKWRSGSRTLRPNSAYTSQIIRHVMALDRSNQFAKIRLMLSSEYLNIFKCSESEIAIFLKDWLTAPGEVTVEARDYFDEIKNLKNTSRLTAYSLTGVSGRQQALLFFLKYAQYISPGAELWLYSTESARQVNSSAAFVEERNMRLMNLLSDGNRIRVIHTFSGFYEALASTLLTWMPMHMTGRTAAYFIPRYKDEQLAYTYFLIKDHLALFNWAPIEPRQELNTYLAHEPGLVKKFELVLESHFAESTILFDRYDYGTRDAAINELVSVLEHNMNEFHWCTSLPFQCITEEGLRGVLEENGITGDELERDMENLMLLKELGSRSQHCYFVDLDGMRDSLSRERIGICELSFICGREITVTSGRFRQLLRAANNLNAESENVKFCLASTDLLKKLGHTDIFVKENTRVAFSTIEGEPTALVAKEITVVTAFYRYFEELWNSTPYICRNKEYVVKRIQKALDEEEKKDP